MASPKDVLVLTTSTIEGIKIKQYIKEDRPYCFENFPLSHPVYRSGSCSPPYTTGTALRYQAGGKLSREEIKNESRNRQDLHRFSKRCSTG